MSRKYTKQNSTPVYTNVAQYELELFTNINTFFSESDSGQYYKLIYVQSNAEKDWVYIKIADANINSINDLYVYDDGPLATGYHKIRNLIKYNNANVVQRYVYNGTDGTYVPDMSGTYVCDAENDLNVYFQPRMSNNNIITYFKVRENQQPVSNAFEPANPSYGGTNHPYYRINLNKKYEKDYEYQNLTIKEITYYYSEFKPFNVINFTESDAQLIEIDNGMDAIGFNTWIDKTLNGLLENFKTRYYKVYSNNNIDLFDINWIDNSSSDDGLAFNWRAESDSVPVHTRGYGLSETKYIYILTIDLTKQFFLRGDLLEGDIINFSIITPANGNYCFQLGTQEYLRDGDGTTKIYSKYGHYIDIPNGYFYWSFDGISDIFGKRLTNGVKACKPYSLKIYNTTADAANNNSPKEIETVDNADIVVTYDVLTFD